MKLIPVAATFTLLILGAGLASAAGNGQAAAAPTHRDKFGDPPAYEVRGLPVTQDDPLILQKTAAMLSSDSVWNRTDDRICEDDEAAGRRSLFCALQKASIDVLGTYDHRRVALQEVRFAIEQATPGVEFEHRLKDYNNSAQVELADIQQVLATAIERVQARLDAAPKQ